MKNILFFTYWYPNKSNKNFALFVKRHAAAAAIQNHVKVLAFIVINGKEFYKRTNEVIKDENNIETHYIYIESRFYKLIYVLLPLHYLILKKYIQKNIFSDFKFSVLHSNIIFPCGIVGHWLSKKFNCKHIITEHWSKINKFFRVSAYSGFGKKAYDSAHSITCVSETLKKEVVKYSSNTSVVIVPNVIDPDNYYIEPSIQKNNSFTFIAVAHWHAPKNPFYFLDALQQIATSRAIPDFKLVLVGTGSQLEQIKAKKYGFSIEMPGNLDTESLRKELNMSHVFLHGSDYETFSVVIAEALMCGLPCVVSPVGIAKEVINESNGYITDNTVNDWKQKILACYTKTYNGELIAGQLKNKYSALTISSFFENVYW